MFIINDMTYINLSLTNDGRSTYFRSSHQQLKSDLQPDVVISQVFTARDLNNLGRI